MRELKASELINSLDAGQQKRLSANVKRVFQDRDQRCFDDTLINFASKYVRDESGLASELDYLRNLTDSEGRSFARSKGKVEDIYAQLESFQAPEKSSFRWNRNYQKALAKVEARYKAFRVHELRYRTEQDIVNSMSEWNSSPGWESIEFPDIRKKKDLLGRCYSFWDEAEREAVRRGTFGKPILLATRTQGSGAYDSEGNRTGTWKSKLRAVEMVNTADTLCANRFTNPLNRCLTYYPYSAIGKTPKQIATWIEGKRFFGVGSWYSLDYSKYDSTIPSWLLRDAFAVVRSSFERLRPEDVQLLQVIEEDFINKNIVVDSKSGTVVRVTHGTASGSKFTAIINGICNEIITETWSEALGYPVQGFMVMGDDNLGFVDPKFGLDVEKIASYVKHNFGIVVNADKSSFGDKSKDPEFLSKKWTKQGPTRSFGDLVSHLAYPERYRNYKKTMLEPWMIFYSYYLDCPTSMREFFDIPRFLCDFGKLEDRIPRRKEVLDQLPWVLRQSLELSDLARRIKVSPSVTPRSGNPTVNVEGRRKETEY